MLVSGLPRSGTSLLMRMLEAGGLPPLSDGARAADADNPRGYYELERVKGLERGEVDWLKEAAGRATKVVSPLLPHLPRIPNRRYVVLFARRRMIEVLASQRRMLERRGAPQMDAEAAAREDASLAVAYGDHQKDIERWLGSRPDVAWLEVDYNTLLTKPEALVASVVEFVAREAGVALDEEAMLAVIEPGLYRQRHPEAVRDAGTRIAP